MNEIDIFKTPLYHCNIEETKSLLPELESRIYEVEKTSHSVQKSNSGGFQSDFINQDEEPVYNKLLSALRSNIVTVINSWNFIGKNIKIGYCWYNINRKGNFNWPHTHPNSDFACVFYVKCDNNAEISFDNPDIMRTWVPMNFKSFNTNTSPMYSYQPKTNDFLMFPAHLSHKVQVNTTDEDRISLSFNLTIY